MDFSDFPPGSPEATAQAVLARWHACVAERNAAALPALLADGVVFHSPVVHRPVTGKPMVLAYLSAAL